MARSRYDTMRKSKTEQDPQTKEYYYDPMSFPIESFNYSQTAVSYAVTTKDIVRIDLLMDRYYGVPEFDDLVLWLNNVPFIWSMQEGDEIELPRRRDIERFYTTFSE